MGLISEFKDFINRGNVMDLAVGVIIGGAFGKIVESLVADVVMPAIGSLGKQPDFKEIMLGPIKIGNFMNSVLAFLILAFAVFMMVKGLSKFKKPVAEAPAATPEDVLLLREIRDSLKK